VPFEIGNAQNKFFTSFFRDAEGRLSDAYTLSDRDKGQSIINDFADFEEINFSKFDFAKEDA
jgi:hypothetical protein